MLEQAVDGVSLRERIAQRTLGRVLRYAETFPTVPAEPRPSLRGQTGRPGACKDRSKCTRRCLMLEFENTIRIDRPVEEVFAFLSDFENIPKWNYYVLEVRQLSEGSIGVGTTYHQVRKSDQQDLRVIEFEPGHTVAVKTLPQSSPDLK